MTTKLNFNYLKLRCLIALLAIMSLGWVKEIYAGFIVIPQSALLTGGIASDPFFLPLNQARLSPYFPRNDDGSTSPINLGFAFNFYGQTFTTIINNNGNISFNNSIYQYIPQTFPIASSFYRMIAPYWTDVNTWWGGGLVYYTQRVYNGRKQFVVTWDNVMHYWDSGFATFQVVLQEDGKIGFAWDSIGWGSATATIGFNAGNGLDGAALSGSPARFSNIVSYKHIFFQPDGAGSFAVAPSLINNAPVANSQSPATAENAPIAITLTGSDTDGDVITFTVLTQPARGTLSGTAPNLTYTPNRQPTIGFNSSDSFSFKVNDGTVDSAPATVSITITPVNDPPVANPQSVRTSEDTPLNITLTGSDVDGDALSFALVSQTTNGTVSLTGATVNYTPKLNFNGSDSFSFKVNDGTVDSAPAIVNIIITPVNDPPDAVNDTETVAEDSSTNIINVLANDTFAPDAGETLTVTAATQPSNGTVSFTATTVSYTPNANFNGTDSFTYTISDGNGGSDTATVAITVTPVNDPPVANAQSVRTSEDTPLNIALTGSDVDGDALSFALVSQTTNGTVSLTGATVNYIPNLNFNGSDSFSFKVNDGLLDSSAATVSLTITRAPKYTHETKKLSIEFFSGEGDPASLLPNVVSLQPLDPPATLPTGQAAGLFNSINLDSNDASTVATNDAGNKVWDISLKRAEQVKIGKWHRFGVTIISATINGIPKTIRGGNWIKENQAPTKIEPPQPTASLPTQVVSTSALQVPVIVEDRDKDIDFIKIKYKIAGGREEKAVDGTTTDDLTWSAIIPTTDLTAAGLSYVVESSDSLGETVKNPASPKRRWVKVKDAVVKSDQRVGSAAVEPLLIPDSKKVVEVDSPSDLKSAKRQFYRLFSMPVDVIERKSSLNLDLDQIFENLGSYTVPSSDINSRKSGYFISNFKVGSWTTQKAEASLLPGQGGLIRAAASTLGDNKFIQLTGSSTPPEGDKDDAATGKLNRTAAEPAHTGVDVELKPGWNIVGVPMYRRFFWSLSSTGGIRVVDTNGVDMGSVGNSIANGVVSPVIYGGYNGSAYTKTIDASNINLSATDSSRVMQPFEGYWVFAFLPCKLRFLASADGPDSSPSMAPPLETITDKQRLVANGGWGISLSARTINSIDGGNIIGYGFKEVDYLKPPSLFEDDVRLSILEEDGLELTRCLVNRLEDKDFVGAQHAAPYWDIKVDSTGNVPVTISGEMLSLPKDYQVMLLSSHGKEVANLKEAPYTYIPKHSGIEVFKIVVAKKRFVPKTSALSQNYPNPFNPETWIPYQLSKAGDVVISIYNVQGQLIRRLSLGYKEAGVYIRKEEAAYWDGRNSLGERVSSGLYFYSLQAGQFMATRKMVVVK